ncbi:MAG: hypothetical protein WD851_11815 [Pirellulales bacterium]
MAPVCSWRQVSPPGDGSPSIENCIEENDHGYDHQETLDEVRGHQDQNREGSTGQEEVVEGRFRENQDYEGQGRQAQRDRRRSQVAGGSEEANDD